MAKQVKQDADRKSFYAKDRQSWRKWLLKNHDKEDHVWLLIYHKKSAKPSVYYDEAVEEALCFGWIDSKPNKRDHESFFLFFAPRKQKSVWSKLNKKRIEELISCGLMMSAGLAKIEAAKIDGSWTTIDDVEEMIMPPDLKSAFAKKKNAYKNFEAFPRSVRKGIFQWIAGAKQPETRSRRIEETVAKAEQNIRANQWKK